MENMKIIKCVPSKLLVVHWYICYFSNRLFHTHFSKMKLIAVTDYKLKELGQEFSYLVNFGMWGTDSETLDGRYIKRENL